MERTSAEKELRQRIRSGKIRREDVTRRLAELAFGRANDGAGLALRPGETDPEGLDLSAVSELKVTDKGVEVKFVDRVRALETLWSLREQSGADTVGCAHLNLTADGKKFAEKLLPAGVYDEQGIREGIVYPLLGDRLTVPVFNGFIWRYLFSASIIRSAHITFEGAYLEDELFLMEYFCNAHKLAVTEQPLYRYFLNPSSATHKYMKNFLQVFGRFMERKEALVKKYKLEDARPQWRENTNWAGLLIAIGNEYAAGNEASVRKKQKAVEELCRRPDMAKAIAEITPMGMTPNKQMVANLVKGKHFFTLTQLYRLKNRI